MADTNIPESDQLKINQLRLSVARAAQRDSLAWWDDESLVPGADILLSRLFPRSHDAAAQHLALRAARARHARVLQAVPAALHLFSLGDAVEFQIEQSLSQAAPFAVRRDPITSRAELEAELRRIAPEPRSYPLAAADHRRAARLDLPLAGMSLLDLASAFAWTYARAEDNLLVLPYAISQSAA